MNEFVQQFLLESRELIEQGTADLLALEKAPNDKERLDSAFRAFHTLKGGSSIVDFSTMAETLHVAEDALSAIRSGTIALSTKLIGDCLACLDQVVRWLDTLETTGEIPKDAQAEADAIVARFAGGQTETGTSASGQRVLTLDPWVQESLIHWSSLQASARSILRYTPEATCFFDGDDPVARIAALPGLLALDLEPVLPWGSLDTFDPFTCNLAITALSRGSVTEVSTAMGSALDQCDIVELAGGEGSLHKIPIAPRAQDVLQAQIEVIATGFGDGDVGRWASAGIVAANVLRNAGRATDADIIARSTEMALAQKDPRCLREAIVQALTDTAAPPPLATAPTKERAAATRTLRVDALHIDALVNLTGELVVAKNAIGHIAALAERGDLTAASLIAHRHALLDRLVSELQRTVLQLRVLPLRHVFQRFPRLLREMSIELAKPVNLVVEGGETEADKVIVEMLFEPLLHVLRNAIDHGVENATTRAARAKPVTATIHLRAERRGEHVIVEVSDDGRGIDTARVRQVAREIKLVPEDALNAMRDEALIDLIFEPGFSTAVNVTRVSGRGVGMDAVRSAVQQVGGHVGIDSRPGQGTTVRFTLPFSVMMTRVMLVTAGDATFGIPLDAVVETLRVSAERITVIGSSKAIVLRNRTVPLVTLAEALGLPYRHEPAEEATVVVTRVGGEYGALHVDRIQERMDVMLKPLDGLLAGTRGIAGSSLVGDGSVLLILDVGELLK